MKTEKNQRKWKREEIHRSDIGELLGFIIIPVAGILQLKMTLFTFLLFYMVEANILWLFDMIRISASKNPFKYNDAHKPWSKSKHLFVTTLIILGFSVFLGFMIDGSADMFHEQPVYFTNELLWLIVGVLGYQLTNIILFFHKGYSTSVQPDKVVQYAVFRVCAVMFMIPIGFGLSVIISAFSVTVAKVFVVVAFAFMRSFINIGMRNSILEEAEKTFKKS